MFFLKRLKHVLNACFKTPRLKRQYPVYYQLETKSCTPLRMAPNSCLWLCGILIVQGLHRTYGMLSGANKSNSRLVYPKRGGPSLSYSHGPVETVTSGGPET